MVYNDIAKEIIEDKELQEKYDLSNSTSSPDEGLVIKALNIIVQEKENNRDEKKTNTAKVTRELNKLFNIT